MAAIFNFPTESKICLKGCGKAEHPGVYVKVTEVLDWIKHTSHIGNTVMYL